jgi:hypothetical protein
MAVRVGHKGQVIVGSDAVAHTAKWKLSIKGGVAKTSGMNEPRAHKGLGNPTITGSIELEALDEADPAVTELRGLALDNSSSTPTLKLYEDTAGYWSGDCVVEDMEVESDDEGMVTGSFSFTGTGAWAYT